MSRIAPTTAIHVLRASGERMPERAPDAGTCDADAGTHCRGSAIDSGTAIVRARASVSAGRMGLERR